MTRRGRGWIGVVLAAIAAGALCAPVQAEPIALRLRLRPGKTYRTRMAVNQTIRQKHEGRSLDTSQSTSFGYRFEVTGVDPAGIATLRVTYDSVQWKQRGPDGAEEYDSQRRPFVTPPAARAYAALENQRFTMRVTPTGRVTDLAGIDRLLERLVEAQRLPRGPARDALAARLKTQFGDPAIRETMEQMLAIYPPRPVNLGDTWGKRVAISGSLPRISDNKWTLTERGNGFVTIMARSQITANTQAAPVPMGPVQVSYLLSGSREGKLRLEETTGWTRSMTIRQSLSGTVTLSGTAPPSGGSKTPQKVSWPITVESTIFLNSK